jgi:glutaredoxin 3
MATDVMIYGKDGCPYTSAARDDYAARGVAVTYFNVKKDPDAMRRFLELSGGDRRVPLIVDGERVSVGFGGT